jgi:hypothetical protein
MFRDNQKKLEFVLTAEASKFKKGISDSLRQLNTMEKGIKSVSSNIKSSFSGIGKNLAIGVAAGVAAAALSLSRLQSRWGVI